MTLYRKYGLNIVPEKCVENWLETKALLGKPGVDIAAVHRGIVAEHTMVALVYHLMGESENFVGHAHQIPKEALDYLFGSWRAAGRGSDEGAPEEEWRLRSLWMQTFIEGIAWGSVIGAWDDVERLAKYPNADCPKDPTLSKELWEFYLILAMFITSDYRCDEDKVLDLCERLDNKVRKYLFKALLALSRRNSVEFVEQMQNWMNAFKKHEFDRRYLHHLVSFDGTVLYNMGSKLNLDIEASVEHQHLLIPVIKV